MINVTVHIGQVMRRTFSERIDDIRINNVPEGFEADIASAGSSCLITLLGLSEELQEIDTNTLEVSVDIAAWLEEEEIETPESGYYMIPLSVSIPEDSAVTWEETEVQVHITEAEEQ